MSEQPTTDLDDDTGQALAPRPTPSAEPQAPPPGGPHAIRGVGGDGAYTTEGRDLLPERNPAADDLPDAAAEPEDTDTAATRGEDSPAPEDESPA